MTTTRGLLWASFCVAVAFVVARPVVETSGGVAGPLLVGALALAAFVGLVRWAIGADRGPPQ